MKIVGYTVGTSLPKPDFKQTDPKKGDYIKNKPDFACFDTDAEFVEGTSTPLDADTLGGKTPSQYALVADCVRATVEEFEYGEVPLTKADIAEVANEATHAVNADKALEADNSMMLGGKAPSDYLFAENILDTMDAVTSNTKDGMVASAKAIKELNQNVLDAVKWIFPAGRSVDVLSEFATSGSTFQAPDDGILLITFYGGFAGMSAGATSTTINGDGGWNGGSSSTPSCLRIFMKKGTSGVLWYSATIKSASFKYCK